MLLAAKSVVQRVEAVLKAADLLPEEAEIQAHWARYACILCAGAIEVCIQEILIEYVRRRSNKQIQSYLSFKYLQNPKTQTIVSELSRFDPQWGAVVQTFVEGERKDAIDSIMANRNIIAHGRSTTISLPRVKRYFNTSVEVLEKVDEIVLT